MTSALPFSPIRSLSPDDPQVAGPLMLPAEPRHEPLAGPRVRFKLYGVDDLPDEGALRFLLDDVLPAGVLAEIHGAPGTGKSFLALAMSLSVTTGVPFLGHNARQGQVVYVAAERFTGLRRRIGAWSQTHGHPSLAAMHVMNEAVNLIDGNEARAFADVVSRLVPRPALIVLDTLSRCLAGVDENSQRDMTKVVGSIERVRQATGATVLLIHHTRKAGDLERGSTVLRGAADLMMSVSKGTDGLVLKADKTNDMAPFPPLHVRLQTVGGSCTVVRAPAEGDEPQDEAPELSARARAVLQALEDKPDGVSLERLGEAARTSSSSVHRLCTAELLPAGFVTKGEGSRANYRITPKGSAALSR